MGTRGHLRPRSKRKPQSLYVRPAGDFDVLLLVRGSFGYAGRHAQAKPMSMQNITKLPCLIWAKRFVGAFGYAQRFAYATYQE